MIYITDYTILVYYPYEASTQIEKEKSLNFNIKHKHSI